MHYTCPADKAAMPAKSVVVLAALALAGGHDKNVMHQNPESSTLSLINMTIMRTKASYLSLTK